MNIDDESIWPGDLLVLKEQSYLRQDVTNVQSDDFTIPEKSRVLVIAVMNQRKGYLPRTDLLVLSEFGLGWLAHRLKSDFKTLGRAR